MVILLLIKEDQENIKNALLIVKAIWLIKNHENNENNNQLLNKYIIIIVEDQNFCRFAINNKDRSNRKNKRVIVKV